MTGEVGYDEADVASNQIYNRYQRTSRVRLYKSPGQMSKEDSVEESVSSPEWDVIVESNSRVITKRLKSLLRFRADYKILHRSNINVIMRKTDTSIRIQYYVTRLLFYDFNGVIYVYRNV